MKKNMEEQVIYLTKPVVTSEGNRVITLAGVVTNDKIFSIGMSLSSPSDKYNQEIGNKIAYVEHYLIKEYTQLYLLVKGYLVKL